MSIIIIVYLNSTNRKYLSFPRMALKAPACVPSLVTSLYSTAIVVPTPLCGSVQTNLASWNPHLTLFMCVLPSRKPSLMPLSPPCDSDLYSQVQLQCGERRTARHAYTVHLEKSCCPRATKRPHPTTLRTLEPCSLLNQSEAGQWQGR